MDQWYAVIRKADGEAVSFGTVIADPLPKGLMAIPIDHQPGRGEAWDAASRSVATTPIDVASPYPSGGTLDQKLDWIAARLP